MSDNYYQHETNEEKKKYKNKSICSFYMITHIIISFFAIYLSWKCNNGFHPLAFLAALCCPYLYIIWALATNGGCGIFDDSQQTLTSSQSPFLLSSQMPVTTYAPSNQMPLSTFLPSNQMPLNPYAPSNQMSLNSYSPTSSMSPVRQIRF
jgi:hypothetical protein